MFVEFKGIYSPDVELKSFIPTNQSDFSLFVQVFFGPKNSDGSESFDFIICTIEWLRKQYNDEIIFLTDHLLVSSYDYEKIVKRFEKLAQSISGKDWHEIAIKLSRYGRWEFEDYQEQI